VKVYECYTFDHDSHSACKIVDNIDKAITWKKEVQELLNQHNTIYRVSEKEENIFYEMHGGCTSALMRMWNETETYKALLREMDKIENILETKYDANAYNRTCDYKEWELK